MTKAILTLLVLLFMTPAFLTNSGAAVAQTPAPTPVVEAAEEQSAEDTALADSLVAILDSNYTFGSGLQDDAALIESACFALLDFAEEAEISLIIRQEYVNTFVKNMYGVEVDPAAGVVEYISAPEGYYVIPPRGLTRYAHEILRTEVQGNTVTVLSAMTVAAHDAANYDTLVKSTFAVNGDSPLGYNLVACEILG